MSAEGHIGTEELSNLAHISFLEKLLYLFLQLFGVAIPVWISLLEVCSPELSPVWMFLGIFMNMPTHEETGQPVVLEYYIYIVAELTSEIVISSTTVMYYTVFLG